MKHPIRTYTLIAFSWSWFFWITAYVLLKTNDLQLFTNETIFTLTATGFTSTTHIVATILFSFGVYGPLAGYFALKHTLPKQPKHRFSFKIILFLVLFTLAISLAPGLIASASTKTPYITAFPLITLPLYFLYQLTTSGTEEFGWRGFLLPHLLKTLTPKEAAWQSGIVWALWHLPVVVYMYQSLPLPALIGTTIGFLFNVIGMSFIYTFAYINTYTIALLVLFHALTNTASIYFLGSLTNPVLGLLPAAIVWGTVFFLEKRLESPLSKKVKTRR